jgi:hypothetical protein
MDSAFQPKQAASPMRLGEFLKSLARGEGFPVN